MNAELLCADSKQASRHWLFAEDIQECLREECIPFDVQGVPAMEGLTTKTVPMARWKIAAQPNEIVVCVPEGEANPNFPQPNVPCALATMQR